jgi:hypothetical protein
MDIDGIKTYLGDMFNEKLIPEAQLNELAELVYSRLDYSPIYNQIDEIVHQHLRHGK